MPSDPSCPVPISRYPHVVLGHGSGGRLSADLLRQVFLPAFPSPILHALEDQAALTVPGLGGGARLAFTTDAFVVRPLFFPGGDVGKLSVVGTLNDLAVGGAEPLFLSAAFILEEGLAITDLSRIAASMQAECAAAGVALVAGDTKVVERGKGDGAFIATSAIGLIAPGVSLSVGHARAGDAIIVSGTLGDHGVAIMSVREGIAFATELVSDCACLVDLCRTLRAASPGLRCMRDPTRGGLTSTLHEVCAAAGVGIEIDEAAVPLRDEVKAACEMLGLDALSVANEGKVMAIVPPQEIEAALQALQSHPLGRNAAVVGRVVAEHVGVVTMRSAVGGERVLSLLAGEQLPRIC